MDIEKTNEKDIIIMEMKTTEKAMKEYTYYTPIDLARAILAIVPAMKIESIIDICCGSWNLLHAGKEKYPTAVITGVDIDKESEKYKIENATFKVMDGREFAENEHKEGKTYDLILSNPPFGSIADDERRYGSHEGLDYYSQLLNKRYECEMIQANMLLAHAESILVFILPYTFVAGVSYQKARCQIAKDYSVLAIINLPVTTFERGRIKTFAIILQKTPNNNLTTIYEAVSEKVWNFKKLKSLQSEEIKNGNWWFKKEKKKENVINVIRGNVSSCSFENMGQSIFHCAAKKEEKWLPSVRYYDEAKVRRNVIKANKGDVIINRIGRAAGYWYVNEQDSVTISDCLLVLKNATNTVLEVLEKNSDNNGRLLVPLRGMTTSYITAEDIKVLF